MFDPNEVFNLSKKELIETLQNSTLETILSQKELIQSYFEFFESMHRLLENKNKHSHSTIQEETSLVASPVEVLSVTNEVHNNESVPDVDSQDPEKQQEQGQVEVGNESQSLFDKLLSEEQNQLQTYPHLVDSRPVYLFERKLEGGFVPAIEGYVPEITLRKLDLQHHDYVYARELQSGFGERKRFIYDFAKRSENPGRTGRVQISFCLVESYDNNFFVRKSMESSSKAYLMENPELFFTLQDKDIERLGIKEGDLVDIAFYEDKPESFKVIWVHRFEENTEKKGRNMLPPKPNKEKDEEELVQSDLVKTLENKTILVIGNEPNKAEYQFEIEKRGGMFLWADAKDSISRIKSLVKKAELVVFLLKVSGHTGMKQIKKYCKEQDVPFITEWSLSSITIAKVVEAETLALVAE
ncbi:DUF2325 domain-containing protein [Brevibacillus sp. NPDC058079]|uniref:DUF2325 domain-containing protein n=1 Tax=Brevibacillus sp. NPDC058079 TaxID=3346330 RepID=UPI0036EBCCCE